MKYNLKSILIVIALLFNIFTPSVVVAQEIVATQPKMTFNDIPPESLFYPAVEYLASRNIFRGYPNGNFEEGNSMNRAELITAMVRMQQIEPDIKKYNNCFPDVKEEWFAPYICYSKGKNWIKGYEDGFFRPDKATSIPEAMKIIFEPLFNEEIASQSQEHIKANIQSFYDGNEAHQNAWYAPYISFDADKNLNSGISGFTHLKTFVDREQQRGYAAQLIFNSLLLKEQGWDRYEYYLSDLYLLKNNRGDLLIREDLCYGGHGAPDEIVKYITDKYEVNNVVSYVDHEDWLDSEKWPFFEIDNLCLFRGGGFLILGSSISEDEKINQHLLRFDKDFQVTEDTVKKCEEEPVLMDSSPHFPSEEMDPETFKLDTCLYSHDDKRVYFGGSELKEAVSLSSEQLTFPFSRDKKNVYFTFIQLPEADPDTFKPLVPKGDLLFDVTLYSKDDQHVYYRADRIEADPETFEVLPLAKTDKIFEIRADEDLWIKYYHDFIKELSFAKDKNGVYFNGRELEGIDPISFEIIDQNYLKDKNGVYINHYSSTLAYHDYYPYQLDQIAEANPDTFEVLEYPFSKDDKSIYYEDSPITEAEYLEILGYDKGALESCATGYAPVCGEVDGEKKSFKNNCLAKKESATSITNGLCTQQEKTWEQACLSNKSALWYPEWNYCAEVNEKTCFEMGGKQFEECGSACNPYNNDPDQLCPEVCTPECFFE